MDNNPINTSQTMQLQLSEHDFNKLKISYSYNKETTAVTFKSVDVTTVDQLVKTCQEYTHSAIEWKDGYRNKENFIAAHSIIFDIDNTPETPNCTIKMALKFFGNYKFIIFPSRSHQKNKKDVIADRFHILFFLENSITDSEIYDNICKNFCNKFSFIDSAAIGTHRMFRPGSTDHKPIINLEDKKYYQFDSSAPVTLNKKLKNFKKKLLKEVSVKDVFNIIYGLDSLEEISGIYQGPCPLPSEDHNGNPHPSAGGKCFNINTTENYYYCFNCKCGGDVINLVMDAKKIGFIKAIEWLREKFYPTEKIINTKSHSLPSNQNIFTANELKKILSEQGIVVFKCAETFEYCATNNNKINVFSKSDFISNCCTIYYNLTGQKIALKDNEKSNFLTYLPIYKREFMPEVDGLIIDNKINIYQDTSQIESIYSAATSVNDFPYINFLLDGLFLEDGLKDHFLNYLAVFLQLKLPSILCWIIKGKEGVGKNVLYEDIITPIFSKDWCGVATVGTQFNGYMVNKRFILFDEAWAADRKNFTNILKNYIGPDKQMMINSKNIKIHSYLNKANFILFTNENTPLIISETNRRFIIVQTGEPLQKRLNSQPDLPNDIEQFIHGIEAELPKFKGFLEQYSINKTNYRTMIHTAAEKIMFETTVSKFEEFGSNMFDAEWIESYLNYKNLTDSSVKNFLNENKNKKYYPHLPLKIAHLIYKMIFEDEVSQNKFKRKMTEYGFKSTIIEAHNIKVRVFKNSGYIEPFDIPLIQFDTDLIQI